MVACMIRNHSFAIFLDIVSFGEDNWWSLFWEPLCTYIQHIWFPTILTFFSSVDYYYPWTRPSISLVHTILYYIIYPTWSL
jgi:hypothetical protein